MADPPFIVAERSLPSDSGPSFVRYYLVFLIVFGVQQYFDRMRYLHISPHKSGYGCNTSIFVTCNTPYHIIWDLSPSMAIHRAIWHGITPKHQVNTTSTKTDHLVAAYVLLWLLVSAFLLPCPPPGLFCRLSVAHQMDTSWDWPYHQ